jgi:hypothetical protein
MAEVTHNSLRYLTSDDATAMSVYLKSLLELKSPAAHPSPVASPSK